MSSIPRAFPGLAAMAITTFQSQVTIFSPAARVRTTFVQRAEGVAVTIEGVLARVCSPEEARMILGDLRRRGWR